MVDRGCVLSLPALSGLNDQGGFSTLLREGRVVVMEEPTVGWHILCLGDFERERLEAANTFLPLAPVVGLGSG